MTPAIERNAWNRTFRRYLGKSAAAILEMAVESLLLWVGQLAFSHHLSNLLLHDQEQLLLLRQVLLFVLG